MRQHVAFLLPLLVVLIVKIKITIRRPALGIRLAVQLQPKAATFGFAREGVSLTGLAASGSKQNRPLWARSPQRIPDWGLRVTARDRAISAT